jgi:hypothetical protein
MHNPVDDYNVVTDLPQGDANHILRDALGFADFIGAIVADTRALADMDARHIDPTDETSREKLRKDGSMVSLRCYVTDARMDDIRPIVSRIRILSVLAARVAKLASADEDMRAIVKAQRVSLAQLHSLDTTLWHIYREQGKALRTGTDAAQCDTDASSWTSSRSMPAGKGRATTIRYDETADAGMRAYKASHSGGLAVGSFSERDLI